MNVEYLKKIIVTTHAQEIICLEWWVILIKYLFQMIVFITPNNKGIDKFSDFNTLRQNVNQFAFIYVN